MEQHNIVVIGGNNVDINATSTTSLVYGDSNPGKIHTGLGGVGRNIAENLTRMGQQTSLITVFGDDEFANLARVQANQIGLDINDSIQVEHAASCVYVCINEPNGDMTIAVNDMELCNYLTPAFLATKQGKLDVADAIVVDANIPEESIDYLVQHCKAPVFADAVSAKKAIRLHRSLPHLCGLKSNQIEVELLTGITITHEHDMSVAAHALHQMGVEYVYITLGGRGAFASDGVTQLFEHPLPSLVVNTTGCGDAFTAATVVATLNGLAIDAILKMGLAAAAVCSQSKHAVSEHMCMDALNSYFINAQ